MLGKCCVWKTRGSQGVRESLNGTEEYIYELAYKQYQHLFYVQ